LVKKDDQKAGKAYLFLFLHSAPFLQKSRWKDTNRSIEFPGDWVKAEPEVHKGFYVYNLHMELHEGKIV
jgi:hypothetical protein